MKKEEKADLLTYLHDYVKDLEANGKSEEEAVKTAIGQFQIREFLEVSRYSGLFELPAHYYLLGYAIVFLAAIIVIQCLLGAVFPDMFLLQAFKFMLILYAAAFVLLPILYKVADVLVRKKMIS
ncbi:hypothetical protein [Sporobacter termitidis]|nr:hypothetical protein [Sporobacter termitidis]